MAGRVDMVFPYVDHAWRRVARKNREAHAWIIEHPLGVIGLEHRRLAGEHRRIKTDACGEVMDREVDLQGVHEVSSRRKQTRSGIGRMRRGDIRMRLRHPKISKQAHDMATYLRSQFNRGFS
jgi:hypothetical protein